MLECEKELLEFQLREYRECTVRVGGACMNPAIRNGARVTLRSARPADMAPGEIVAYFAGTSLFVHRLVSKGPGKLMIRADSGKPGLHEVPEKSVVGKVVGIKNPSLFGRAWEKMHRKMFGQKSLAENRGK
jgi:hypothetical protein